MKEKSFLALIVICTASLMGFVVHKTLGAQSESFVIERKSKKAETSRQLKEKLIVLLEDIAHAETKLMQGLSLAQEQLLYRMHELLEESDGPFSSASYSVLKQRVAEAEKLRDTLKILAGCVADLNIFLKKQ